MVTYIYQLRFFIYNKGANFEQIYHFRELKQLFQFIKEFFKPNLISGVTITKIDLWQKDLRKI